MDLEVTGGGGPRFRVGRCDGWDRDDVWPLGGNCLKGGAVLHHSSGDFTRPEKCCGMS